MLGLWCGLAAPDALSGDSQQAVAEIAAPGWLEIFGHNTLVLGMTLGGVFSFGLSAVLTLFMSGLHVGIAFGVAYSEFHDFAGLLWLILPHCFEAVCLWMGGALGLRGVREGIRNSPGEGMHLVAKHVGSIGLWILLLAAAAIVEAEISIGVDCRILPSGYGCIGSSVWWNGNMNR